MELVRGERDKGKRSDMRRLSKRGTLECVEDEGMSVGEERMQSVAEDGDGEGMEGGHVDR